MNTSLIMIVTNVRTVCDMTMAEKDSNTKKNKNTNINTNINMDKKTNKNTNTNKNTKMNTSLIMIVTNVRTVCDMTMAEKDSCKTCKSCKNL